MRNKKLWRKRALAVISCAAITLQPMTAPAADFSAPQETETQESPAVGESPADVETVPQESEENQTGSENESQESDENQNSSGTVLNGNLQAPETETGQAAAREDGQEDSRQTFRTEGHKGPKGEALPQESFSDPDSDFESGFGESASDFNDGETPFADGGEEQAAAQSKNGTCGKNLTWTLENGVLTIDGTGEMDRFYKIVDWFTGELLESNPVPWEDYANSIREVYVKDGVTSIGDTAFADCYNLKKAVIGDSVKKIGQNVFSNDRSLVDLTLGNSVEEIELDAFYGTGITELILPASIKNLTDYSLVGLWNVERIEIPDNGIYSSKDGILYSDNGKTLFMFPPAREGEYTVPDSVTKIRSNSFSYTSLTKLTISDSVTEIGDGAIDYGENLKTLVFGKGIKVIPNGCCYYDRALTSVIIPEGVTSIKQTAFWWCTSLREITLPVSVTEIEKAFESNTNVTILNPRLIQLEDGTFTSGVQIQVDAQEMYTKAFEVLDMVNQERAKEGISPLVMDQSLLDTAMLRGFENVLYWSHTRPNGTDCFTANNSMMGENIACGSTTAQGVMNQWMNSAGHKRNILTQRFHSIGIGCVCYQGVYYWVQCFGETSGNAVSASSYTDRENVRNVLVKKTDEYYAPSLKVSATSLKVGQTADVNVMWKNNGLSGREEELENCGAVIESSNPDVCTVKNGKITAVGEGTAQIRMYFADYPEDIITKPIQVTAVKPTVTPEPGNENVQLTFNPNRGKVTTKSKTVKAGAKMGTLPKPTRAGFTFTGWYTPKTGGKKVTSSTVATVSQKLYAHWKKITLPKVTIKKANSPETGELVIVINEVSGADGYEITYAQNNKFKYGGTFTTTWPEVDIMALSSQSYYIKVRAYKEDSAGNLVYGEYSKIKKIKVK